MNGTDKQPVNNAGGQPGKVPELLAPAGSLAHLKAAVTAGADAVYMGGEKFSARAYAQNLSRGDVREALRYAHFYGRKLYLTVNTLMKEREIRDELYDFLLPYYIEGLDGVIVQDFGTVRFIRTHFPEMEVHASTQMTITDAAGAKAAARMGMTRVVPARELSFAEIRQIKEESGLEVEVFAHGALCYCYSGQCLMSSFYGDRSGNRGRCTQPCRLPYRLFGQEPGQGKAAGERAALVKAAGGKEAQVKAAGRKTARTGRVGCGGDYLLSPRDLCTLPVLPALMEIPVDSLKIEGRMKNVEYVAGVTAIYRKYIDQLAASWEKREHFAPDPEDMHYLEELYCRTAFTDGYGMRHNGSKMMSVVSPKNTGRKIGKVISVVKNRVRIQTGAPLAAKDILVIFLPGRKQEEIVLTVPDEKKRKNFPDGQIELNAPESKRIRPGMAVYRRRSEQLLKTVREDILEQEIRFPADGKIVLAVGRPAELTLRCRGEEVTLKGAAAEVSQKRPLVKEDVLRQMNKTGNVPFTLRDFAVEMDEGCFLPLSEIKALRQSGFALLKDRLSGRGRRKEPAVVQPENTAKTNPESIAGIRPKKSTGICPENIAAVYDEDIFAHCCADDFFAGIVLPWEFFPPEKLLRLADKGRARGKKMYLAMPRVFRRPENGAKRCPENGYEKSLEELCRAEIWDGIYVYTVNEAEFLQTLEGFNGEMIAAASLYACNSFAIKELNALCPAAAIRELPVELSGKETQELFAGLEPEMQAEPEKYRFEMMVYGRVPVMQSAQCLKKTTGRCDKKPGQLWMEDRKGRKLPVTTHCRACYNLIWSDEPRSLIGEEFCKAAAQTKRRRFDLFMVSAKELAQVKERYTRWSAGGFHRDHLKESPDHHWNRGIE